MFSDTRGNAFRAIERRSMRYGAYPTFWTRGQGTLALAGEIALTHLPSVWSPTRPRRTKVQEALDMTYAVSPARYA